jgi:hypothetical protein
MESVTTALQRDRLRGLAIEVDDLVSPGLQNRDQPVSDETAASGYQYFTVAFYRILRIAAG